MAKPRNRNLDYVAYVILRVLTAVLRCFPVQANYAVAGLIGTLLYHLDGLHRHRGIMHVQKSYPRWSPRQVRAVAKSSLRHLVYLGMELLFTPQFITPTTWWGHIRFRNMAEVLRLLVERKTGLLMVTGHYGNWEVLGYTIATLGFPNVAVARPLDNPNVNAYVTHLREKKGLRLLDKRGAAEQLDRLLQDKQAVGFIADQDAGRKGLFVDFFGRAASTYKSIALMAIRHQVPIVVGYGRRLGTGFLFELGAERVIHPREWADKDDPVRWITQTYTHALEQIIRRDPEQYLWAHRRWKHRPKGEPPAAGGIA